jgi:RNA polymerase subunit RPABC4/transcription elongation factor Spt4
VSDAKNITLTAEWTCEKCHAVVQDQNPSVSGEPAYSVERGEFSLLSVKVQCPNCHEYASEDLD